MQPVIYLSENVKGGEQKLAGRMGTPRRVGGKRHGELGAAGGQKISREDICAKMLQKLRE
jgi:hypothetical protein